MIKFKLMYTCGLISVFLAQLTGCKDEDNRDSCEKICDINVESEEVSAERANCGLYSSHNEMKEMCLDWCYEDYNNFDASGKAEVDSCIECIDGKTGKSPHNDDFDDAIYECENKCDGEDAEELLDTMEFCKSNYDWRC